MRIAIALCVAAILALSALGASGANHAQPFVPRVGADVRTPRGIVCWYDDLEDGAPGWTHGDDSEQETKFHIDTYLAFDDPTQDPDYSWWCGELNPTFAGGSGYGNLWNQWLELPPIELGAVAATATTWGSIKAMYRESARPETPEAPKRSVTPVLTFQFRCDTEAGYDFVWIEAESLGQWVALNPGGWYGKTGGWLDLGPEGFDLSGFDDPLRIRFRFESDGGYSDADGGYLSDGGAFHVDNISVFDAITGGILFREDCEGGVGQCVPGAPGPAGDYWRLIDNACQAYSGTNVWSASWPDSGSVPPNLQSWLMTPAVDIGTGAAGCTLYFVQQMFMSGAYGGSWQECGSSDGGETWTTTGWWYGHQCQFGSGPYGPCAHFLGVIPIIGPGLPYGSQARGKWVMLTDSGGNGCDVGSCPLGYCSAGITIDDTWVEATYL